MFDYPVTLTPDDGSVLGNGLWLLYLSKDAPEFEATLVTNETREITSAANLNLVSWAA